MLVMDILMLILCLLITGRHGKWVTLNLLMNVRYGTSTAATVCFNEPVDELVSPL